MNPCGLSGNVELTGPPAAGTSVQRHLLPPVPAVVGDLESEVGDATRHPQPVQGVGSHRDPVPGTRLHVAAEVGLQPVVEVQHGEPLHLVARHGVGHEPPLGVRPGGEPEHVSRPARVGDHPVGPVAGRHLPELHVEAELVLVDQVLALVHLQVERRRAERLLQEPTHVQLGAGGAPGLDVPGHEVLTAGVVDPEGVAVARTDRRGEPVQPRRLAEVVGPLRGDHRPRQGTEDVLRVRLDPLLARRHPLDPGIRVVLELVRAERRGEVRGVAVARRCRCVHGVVAGVDPREVTLRGVVDQRLRPAPGRGNAA